MKCTIKLREKTHSNVDLHHDSMKRMVITGLSEEPQTMEVMDIKFNTDCIEINGWLGVEQVTVEIRAFELDGEGVEWPDPLKNFENPFEELDKKRKELIDKAVMITPSQSDPVTSKEVLDSLVRQGKIPSFKAEEQSSRPVKIKASRTNNHEERMRKMHEAMAQDIQEINRIHAKYNRGR